MTKSKYKFNRETLSYDKISHSVKDIFLRILAYFVGSLLVALVYFVIFVTLFDSPKEKLLRREVEQLTLQYELIQREMSNVEIVLDQLQETDDNLYRTIFEVDPIPETYRESGIGGVNRYKDLEGLANADLVIETAKRLDNIFKKVYVQSKSFDDLIALAKNKDEMLKAVPAIMPIANKDLKRTASGFGPRMHPIYKIIKFHNGMDFTASTGTEIYATGDGTIESVTTSSRGLGNHVVVNHGFGYKTTYAHMSKFNVRRGAKVKRGDVIGYVGNTGLSVAPHLHYEVTFNGEYVNPVNYYFNDLTSEEYDRMITISANTGKSFD